METSATSNLAKRFRLSESHTKLFGSILILSLVAGVATGYFLASSSSASQKPNNQIPLNETQKSAQKDTKTFRDFAEGKITAKPQPKDPSEYSEGTHLLVREKAVPVALTSSVVDLAQFEGKNVKVFGETQKAIKEGWLMDIGKVEEK